MGILSYYFASSLDGFIARENGSVDWLDDFQAPLETPYDYKKYYSTVSALIIGRKTWEFIQNHGGEYPYAGKPVYLFTTQKSYKPTIEVSTLNIQHRIELKFIQSLIEKYPDKIWLVGGGNLAAHLMSYNLIDEIVITVIPIILGKGIKWIGPHNTESLWSLKEHYISSNGIQQSIYHRH